MEAIHKLKVICPYEIIKIEDIEISSKPNEHGYLYLKCLIDDNIKFKYSIEATTEDTIILYEELESGKKSIIFNGIIENIRTTNENGIYYLELEGASRSSLLDIKVKNRSFQDADMSYDNLINEILKDYKGLGFTQCMSRPMSIGKPLFQYKETDYEFLKRVASLLGLEIICDIINPGNAFYFGRPEGELYELKDEINYKACKDLERYYKAQTRDFGVEFHDTDFFYYEVENSIKMDIGDKIYFKQKDLYVNQYEAKLYKGDFIYTYRFCRKKGIWREKIYNHKIKGISLEGEVLETAGEKLKIHLYIDESQDPSKAAWFYYTPPTGNILYSMPLVGESATLYFQDEIDGSPIVTSCVRKNGSTCEAMYDTANRYFATESGNYLDMLPGAINFHRSGLNVSFNDDNGIDFSSSGNLSVGGSGGVSLSAGSVSISATSKLLVQKGNASYVSLENEFYAEASVVYESGSSRESYAAFTDDEPTAGAAEALAKQKAALAKKNAERLKFNNGNLFLGMSGARATSGQVPTLNGSIMGSAGKNPGESYIGPATKGAIPVYEQDWEIDARNFRNAPGEYKLGFLAEYFYDRTFGYASQIFTFFGLCDGMQPQYAQVYGDMMSGMVFESVATVATSGLKSASGLNKGFVSGDDIIAGNGFGNTAKGAGKATDELIENAKKITKFDNPGDPFRDVFGQGSESNPEEWNKLINNLRESGVEVVERKGALAYGPLREGVPGQILVDPDASMSALRHEYNHFLEAKANGYPSAAECYQNWEARIEDESKAYNIEIEEAKRLGLDNVAEQLQKNFEDEKQYITDRFGPIE